MDFTTREVLLAILGSGGLIGGLISLLVFISSRIDKRRENIEKDIHNSVEHKRLEHDKSSSVEQALWKIIDSKNKEIEILESKAKDLEATTALTRPIITNILSLIRSMRKELDSINVIMMGQEETSIFFQRWTAVKKGLDELEKLLP